MDNFSYITGKHSLRFGGEYRYNQFPQVGNEFPRGQFYFNSQFTNVITATGPTTATQSGGYVGADFMLGYIEQRHCRRLAGSGRFPQQRMGGCTSTTPGR